MNIAVAISGGVDSLFALLALREQGHQVSALHARFLSSPCAGADPAPGLSALCARLGVPLRVVDLSAPFAQLVVQPFFQEHCLARTPNPCAVCNRTMKFGRLLDEALNPSDGGPAADALATGHYVALQDHPVYGRCLRAGADGGKDQSYFLALTPLERLRRCVFPLGGEHKTAIRAWLAERGEEPPLPRESQEICFVPHDDHRAWLLDHAARTGNALPGPGPVALDDGTGPSRVLGEHHGLWQYTEGQRKGLGIAWSEPLFVVRRDRENNVLVVGPKAMAGANGCVADAVNVLVPPELWPDGLRVRTRYRQAPTDAEVRLEDDRLIIRFAVPQTPPAPGQVAAVYDRAGFVLAGGVLADFP